MINPTEALLELLAEPLSSILGTIEDVITTIGFEIDVLTGIAESALNTAGVDLSAISDSLFGEGESFLADVFGGGVSAFDVIIEGLDLTFEQMASGLVSDIFGDFSSITTILEGLIPDVITEVKTGLDGAFDNLGGIFTEITTEIGILLNPLTEEFSFFNISLEKFGFDLIGSLTGLFDIDEDKLVESLSNVNRKLLEVRAKELGVG